MLSADIIIRKELYRTTNEYIRTLTKIKETFSDIFFDNLDKNNGLSEMAQECMDNASKEICYAKSELSGTNTENKNPITYC